jgi:hypothetical protein
MRKLASYVFKYSVLTSKKTQPITITNVNRLILLKEIMTVYSENHTKPINTRCVQKAETLFVKARGT